MHSRLKGQETYDWNTVGHANESKRREEHEYEDDLEKLADAQDAAGEEHTQRVFPPEEPTFSKYGGVGTTVGMGETEALDVLVGTSKLEVFFRAYIGSIMMAVLILWMECLVRLIVDEKDELWKEKRSERRKK